MCPDDRVEGAADGHTRQSEEHGEEAGCATSNRVAAVPVPADLSSEQLAGPGLGAWCFWLASAGALLAAMGSAVGLLASSAVYGQETETLADQATAQDLVNLLLVAPLTIVLGWFAHRGRVRAYLIWLGCLAFTVYNYAIYAFSIHFGPLFLGWVAVLGLTAFALIGGFTDPGTAIIRGDVTRRAVRWSAGFLIGVAALFALLWLREIVPDLIAGRASRSASEWQVPTNPVHVLDLAFFLPAAAAGGVMLLRGHPLGYATAAGQLTWVALTGLPILVTPLVAAVRGHQPAWGATGPIGVIVLCSLAAMLALLRHLETWSPEHQATSSAPVRDLPVTGCSSESGNRSNAEDIGAQRGGGTERP